MCTSPSLTVRSSDDVARYRPSGEKETVKILSEWRCGISCVAHVCKANSFTVSPSRAEARNWPSDEKPATLI